MEQTQQLVFDDAKQPITIKPSVLINLDENQQHKIEQDKTSYRMHKIRSTKLEIPAR